MGGLRSYSQILVRVVFVEALCTPASAAAADTTSADDTFVMEGNGDAGASSSQGSREASLAPDAVRG